MVVFVCWFGEVDLMIYVFVVDFEFVEIDVVVMRFVYYFSGVIVVGEGCL